MFDVSILLAIIALSQVILVIIFIVIAVYVIRILKIAQFAITNANSIIRNVKEIQNNAEVGILSNIVKVLNIFLKRR